MDISMNNMQNGMRRVQSIKEVYVVKTKEYTFQHSVELPPSTIFDYDYSYTKRFPITCLHEVTILDNVTHIPVTSFEFTSDTCAEMVHTLYRLWASTKTTLNHPIDMVIKVAPEKTSNHVISFVSAYAGFEHPIIWCMIRKDSNSVPEFMFRLDGKEEIKSFIDLLETNDIVDMFVSPSTDRD